jgi:predicted dehydrogenase
MRTPTADQSAHVRRAVRTNAPFPTTPADAVANMRAIAAIYAAAGRPQR